MATECQLPFSDEDSKLLDEARERGIQGLSQETYEEVMPEVERAIEERCVECLQENVDNSRKELLERLAQNEPTDIERLDLRAEPTDKEYKETFKIGREIRMEGYEIANYPIIMGIKDPETLERIPDMEVRVRDEMSNLHNSKLAPRFRDAEVVDRIMFIDKNQPGSTVGKVELGDVLKKGYFTEKPELSRVAHIFRDPATGKLPKDQKAHRVAIHEICHLNIFKGRLTGEPSEFEKIFIDHLKEWERSCEAQLEGPGVANPDLMSGISQREEAFSDPEFIAEHVAFWDADLGVEICPEMKEFFDKYLT